MYAEMAYILCFISDVTTALDGPVGRDRVCGRRKRSAQDEEANSRHVTSYYIYTYNHTRIPPCRIHSRPFLQTACPPATV